MSDWTTDPVVVELRERIAAADGEILAKVNERIELVEALRRYKEERGYPFVDQAREEWLIAHLTELNRGPLSATGVRQLFTSLLDLVKREIDNGRPDA
jgi:chorismate mutase